MYRFTFESTDGIMKQEWKDVPFSLGITLDEKVPPTELPLHLGKSSSLDKQIAAALQTEDTNQVYFLDKGCLIGITIPASLELDGEVSWIELEIEGKSSGYYYPGHYGGPPEDYYPDESDDERFITEVTVVFFDKENNKLRQLEITDEKKFEEFQEAFDKQLYEAELPEEEPDYPDEY